MRTISMTISIAILSALASCATPPERIAATAYPDDPYIGKSCAFLADETKRTSDELAALSKKQKDTVAADTIGVIVIGVPVSSLAGGDKKTEISVLKGKIEALKRASKSSGC